MLRIVLKEFRCWKNLQIDIPLGGVTLIKGDSGCGKSTILQSILWCLYGKIKLVTPITIKKANTEVSLEFPIYFNNKNGIINITRTKSTRVTLSHSNEIYEDKIAQEIINELFGTYDLWLASCYVGQGNRNTFLTAPNSGKMELLNSIAFHEEDPRIFIEKITEVFNEKNTIYNIKLAEYNKNIITLEILLKQTNIDKALSEQENKNLLEKITILENELLILNKLKIQYDIDIATLNNLYKQLDNLKQIVLPEPNDDLKNLMIKYNYDDNYNYHEINNIVSLLSNKDQILGKDNLDDDLPKFSMEDYNKCINTENLYNHNYNLLLSLNINCNYDENSINNRIKNINDTISYNEYLHTKKEYDLLIEQNLKYENTENMEDLLKELDDIKNDINRFELEQIPNIFDINPPDYSKYDISQLENNILILKQKLSEQVINKNSDKCDDIKRKLSNLNDTLKNIHQNNDINLLNTKLTKFTQNLNDINNEIYKLKLNNKVLKCPKCDEAVNLENDELVICHNDFIKINIELEAKQIEANFISLEIEIIKRDITNTKDYQNKQFKETNDEIKFLSDQLITYDDEYSKLKTEYNNQINNEIFNVNKQIENIKFEAQTVKFKYDQEINNKKSQLLEEKRNKISKLKDLSNKLELKITKLKFDNNIHIQNQKRISILELKLSEYNDLDNCVSILSSKDQIDDLKNILSKLRNIKIINKSSYISNYILDCINYNNRKIQYNEIINKIPKIWSKANTEEVRTYNEKMNNFINLLNTKQQEKNYIDSNKKFINDQIDKIKINICENPEIKLIETKNLINQYKNDISLSKKANEAINYREYLALEREKIMEMNNELVNLQLLKQHALETECKSLQDVISSINLSIENVCTTLFDREINITLSLFKTIKSTKTEKPTVNFQISYKGGIFDNINCLSGGEGDRTSIALTLALYRLSSFPLLMLDETLASLDHDMKEATVDTLAGIINQNKNRCIVVVLHDCVNGIFENVIDLQEITEGRY